MKQPALFVLLLLSLSAFTQSEKSRAALLPQDPATVHTIALKPEHWDFSPQSVEFLVYKSRPAMKVLTSNDPVILKDMTFTDGTIEYDMEPLDPRFTSLYFRWQNPKENECFYFRTGRAGNAQAIDAVQYAPLLDGINLWDLLFYYQANADFRKGEWNHVKLLISGKQMRAFVNDMARPALAVPMLEGNTATGTLAFDGQVIISNLRVKPHDADGLAPEAGIDPLGSDPRYLRNWQVCEPITTAQNIDFSYAWVPGAGTKWEEISAERRGLVNLTRRFGGGDGRRIVWLKTGIHSEQDQTKTLRLGFSDEVWVIINDSSRYVDKNLFNTPMAKQPDGRCSIENTSFEVPLQAGENQLMIGVTNFFYGWGIVARFDDLDEIRLEE